MTLDWTWGVMAASVIGTVANAYRKRWGFAVWFVTNLAWCIYDYLIGAHAQSALFAVYTGLAVLGWVQWGKAERRAATAVIEKREPSGES